jgi:VRR-NUC domain
VNELALLEHERLDELEAIIERGLQTFVEVGLALSEIRESHLYREVHATFEDYCRERWDFTDRRARQLIAAAEIGTMVPVENERQARELAPLREQPERLRETWAEVRENNSEPTALHVREAVEKKLAPKQVGAHGHLAHLAQSRAENVSERDFQKTVTDALTLFGWRWCHFRPARTQRGWRTALSGAPGFPDLVAVRGDRVLFAELKAANGKLRDEQQSWLSALGATGAVEVHCWRPSDWPFLERVIR